MSTAIFFISIGGFYDNAIFIKALKSNPNTLHGITLHCKPFIQTHILCTLYILF